MTEVDICNLALSYLGDTATVVTLSPPAGSAQAQHCARLYPISVGLMLEEHNWNFITKRVVLALVQSDCELNRPWRYTYAVPADANTVLSVKPKKMYFGGLPWQGEWWRPLEFEREREKDFQLEINATGAQIILSNACEAVGRYTTKNVQPGVFPALFTDGLAWKLASMLAGPILKGDAGAKMAVSCAAMAERQTSKAKVQDANQQRSQLEHVPDAIRARQ